MSDTHSPFTILAQTQVHLLRCVQSPTDTLLQEFTPAGLVEVRLDATELLAFLRCLPRTTLLEAVGVNPFFGLDDAPTNPAYGLCRCAQHVSDSQCGCGAWLCTRCMAQHADGTIRCASRTMYFDAS